MSDVMVSIVMGGVAGAVSSLLINLFVHRKGRWIRADLVQSRVESARQRALMDAMVAIANDLVPTEASRGDDVRTLALWNSGHLAAAERVRELDPRIPPIERAGAGRS